MPFRAEPRESGTHLGFLEGRHDLPRLVLQLLQLLAQLGHQLHVVLQLSLHAAQALLALLQVAAATRKHVLSLSTVQFHLTPSSKCNEWITGLPS